MPTYVEDLYNSVEKVMIQKKKKDLESDELAIFIVTALHQMNKVDWQHCSRIDTYRKSQLPVIAVV